MARTPIQRNQLLHERLELLVETFDFSTISPDPLELVHAWSDPLDQEVAALIAAAFAYGRAGTVVTNIGRVLRRMSPSPYRYLAESFSEDDAGRRFAGFAHRFQKTRQLVSLLSHLSRAIRKHHSLGELFQKSYSSDDRDIAPALTRFVAEIIGNAPANERKSLSYLLTSPQDGSACKRMNLFLRWMVRREAPDLGLWTFVDPAKLVMPLDTHIHRISTFLGLNRRKSPDWKAARGVTDRLARLNAADPVRYDFAICRLGILDLCSRKRRREQCDVCLLNDVCRLRLR